MLYPHLSWTQSLNVCVFDGGGPNPLCGRELYNQGLDTIYKNKSVARIDFLSGDGNDVKNDCSVKYYGEMSCESSEKSHYQKVETPSSLGAREGYSTPAILNKSYATETNVLPGNLQSFQNGCFPAKSDSTILPDPKSVCHLWSTNHGMKSGITTYRSQDLISPGTLGNKIKNSSCGTTRMVLNNCYSGQFMKLAIDDDGNAVPGVCGVSATTQSEVAIGSSIELKRIEDSKGEEYVLVGTDYDFTREFNKALVNLRNSGRVPTMDEAFAMAQMNDSKNEFPTSTSSYFIKQYKNREGFNVVESESVLIDCLGQKLGLNLFSSQLSELSVAINKVAATLPQNGIDSVSVEMQALAQQDLANQKRRLAEFEKKLCSEYYKGECDPKKASEFIQSKYQNAKLNGQSAVAQELSILRAEFAKKSAAHSTQLLDYNMKLQAQVSAENNVITQMNETKLALRSNFIEDPERRLTRMEASMSQAKEQLAIAKGKDAKILAQETIDRTQNELELERARQAPFKAEIIRLEKEKKRLESERLAIESNNPHNLPLARELSELNERINSISSSALLDLDKMAPKDGFAVKIDECGSSDEGSDNKLEFSNYVNRYAEMRENFATTTQMMSSGSLKDINNYLIIKQCEMTDFYKPAF